MRLGSLRRSRRHARKSFFSNAIDTIFYTIQQSHVERLWSKNLRIWPTKVFHSLLRNWAVLDWAKKKKTEGGRTVDMVPTFKQLLWIELSPRTANRKTVNEAHSNHLFSCFVTSKLFSFSRNFGWDYGAWGSFRIDGHITVTVRRRIERKILIHPQEQRRNFEKSPSILSLHEPPRRGRENELTRKISYQKALKDSKRYFYVRLQLFFVS